MSYIDPGARGLHRISYTTPISTLDARLFYFMRSRSSFPPMSYTALEISCNARALETNVNVSNRQSANFFMKTLLFIIPLIIASTQNYLFVVLEASVSFLIF